MSDPMNIGIFPLTAKKEGLRIETLRAFRAFLSGTRHSVNWVEGKGYRKCDLAIIYGSPGIGGGRRRQIRQAIVSHHRGPLLIVETPLLGRKVPSLRRSILPFF